jgi:hypothetical protein
LTTSIYKPLYLLKSCPIIDKVKLCKASKDAYNPNGCGLFGGVLFREMKFVLSNYLSNEDLSISYES